MSPEGVYRKRISWHRFFWKGAGYHIWASEIETVKKEIAHQRSLLEAYIDQHPQFAASLEPIEVREDAPKIAKRMAEAARCAGVGPMAAVAGAIAQAAAVAALGAGDREVMVNNGGDIFLSAESEVVVGLFAGDSAVSRRLGLKIEPSIMPLAICSSSSLMGHSLSLGHCDLACVLSRDAALADAAATRACNSVKTHRDIQPTLEMIVSIPNVSGIMIVEEGQIGLAGNVPPLVEHSDASMMNKVPLWRD
jgi:ApbE superfamily uncharacterized protein (UPF0280 family)